MKRAIKAALLDLDGTLVDQDSSELVANILGVGDQVAQNNKDFHHGVTKGPVGLVKSINLLKGLEVARIIHTLNKNNKPMAGAHELMQFFHEKGILTILASGSITPVRDYYCQKFGIDYTVGSEPKIENGVIQGIAMDDYPDPDFKMFGIRKILEEHGIGGDECVAIGDSPAERSQFAFAGMTIAINPRGDIAKDADYVIENDLQEAIKIIKEHSNQ